MIHHCSQTNIWRIPWNSIRNNKIQGGGGASGRSFDNYAIKPWYHEKHIYMSGGRNAITIQREEEVTTIVVKLNEEMDNVT